jgi:hypothetical protein
MPHGVQQADQLPLSTWLIAPTSTSARAAGFRAVVEIGVAQIRGYLPSRPQPRTEAGSATASDSLASTGYAALMLHCASPLISEHLTTPPHSTEAPSGASAKLTTAIRTHINGWNKPATKS